MPTSPSMASQPFSLPLDPREMNTTPLSDLMRTYQESTSIEDFDALVEYFATVAVGVHLSGLAPQATERNLVAGDGEVSVGNTIHGDGKSRVVAFADPREFNRRFGPKCNGEMLGMTLFEVVLHNPSCHGILVNSAVAESSVIIPREEIESAFPFLSRAPAMRPNQVSPPSTKSKWWQVWK